MAIFLTDFLTPLPTVIIRRFGMKGYMICSLSGTLILTFSCLTSSVVDDISWLFLTFSFLNGLGSSLIFISSTLVVSEYFPPDHKYHLLATSLFQCTYPTSEWNHTMVSCASNSSLKEIFKLLSKTFFRSNSGFHAFLCVDHQNLFVEGRIRSSRSKNVRRWNNLQSCILSNRKLLL